MTGEPDPTDAPEAVNESGIAEPSARAGPSANADSSAYVGGQNAEWQRLSPRTVTVTGIVVGAIALAIAVFLVIVGVPAVWVLPFVPVALLLVVGPEILRWQRTAYRLTDERMEIRSGILVRAAKSIPRDRIRSVDVTADPVSRIFRVAVLRVGTGQHTSGGSDETKLDSLAAADAELLRTELLRRDVPPTSDEHAPVSGQMSGQVSGPASGSAGWAEGAAEPATSAGVPERRGPFQLARLNPGWIRYAPAGLLTPLLGAAAVGALFQVGDWFEQHPWQFPVFRPAVETFQVSTPMIVLGMVLALLAFLVAGAIGATAIWVETWWNYRLEYGQGVFRVRRGLLTSRSISFEEARLRGIELAESITLRRLGVGQPNVVATGMETKAEQEKGVTGQKTLMPPVPLSDAHAVISAVLDEERSPLSDVALTAHPKAALRRRLVWTSSSVTALALVLALLGWWLTPVLLWIALVVAVFGYVVLPPFAVDAYRNLGHALNGRFLLTRHGTVIRRTVALQRSGVIGWKVRQSFFQRRAGVATVTATTAAGNGRYAVYDAELADGLDFADAAVPDLLAPFLQRSDSA